MPSRPAQKRTAPKRAARTPKVPPTAPLSTCLWFDHQGLEAAELYVSLFPRSRILETTRYRPGTNGPAGAVLTVRYVLDGTEYLHLNGGPLFPHSPAASLVASVDTQAEVDRLWKALLKGGEPSRCGWLTDRFGISWQIVPRPALAWLNASDEVAAKRTWDEMMTMSKLDLGRLKRAFEGR